MIDSLIKAADSTIVTDTLSAIVDTVSTPIFQTLLNWNNFRLVIIAGCLAVLVKFIVNFFQNKIVKQCGELIELLKKVSEDNKMTEEELALIKVKIIAIANELKIEIDHSFINSLKKKKK